MRRTHVATSLAVAMGFVLVLTPVLGGVTTTLGASPTDPGRVQVSPPDFARQNQTENDSTVAFGTQTTDGTVVTVSRVDLPDGGFVAIHDRSVLNGSVLGSVLGVSTYLEAGSHENVTVELDEPITESRPLLALAYRDTNGNHRFDFVSSQGQQDGPYTVDNRVVADDAFVTVEAAPETPTTTVATPTTTTPAETTTTAAAATTAVEHPVEERLFVFRIDSLRVEEFSFVVGDSTAEVDRTVVVADRTFRDESVTVDLTSLLRGASFEESLESTAGTRSGDLQTVRIVVRNVTVEDATFVATAPEGVTARLAEAPTETTTDEVVPGTTTPETTTVEAPPETPTATAEVASETTTTTTEAPPEAQPSLRVSTLDVSRTVVLDDEPLVVSAGVRNPSDVTVTETVQLRIDGTLVEERTVTVEPSESSQVQFRVEKEDLDLEPGDAFLDVLTRDFGKTIQITVVDDAETSDTTTAEN